MKFYIWKKEIEFDEIEGNILLDNKKILPSIRTYGDMKNMYSKENINISDKEWLYLMFRWVYLDENSKSLFKKNDLRYDITIILPKIIWNEFNKTYWHYHPLNKSWKRFEEIYEVLSWSALFLQQNNSNVKYTSATSWDKVIMEEWFGHVTINPSDKEILVMANIVDDTFESEYWEYKELKWANYYYTTDGFIKNPNYKKEGTITESKALFEWEDMYLQFIDNPDKFNFLH